jgi:cytochrome c-type biogenesis protein CcmE
MIDVPTKVFLIAVAVLGLAAATGLYLRELRSKLHTIFHTPRNHRRRRRTGDHR